MATFRAEGHVMDYTPDADVSSGDIVEVGELVGVAKLDIASGEKGALALDGIFELADAEIAETADSVSIGDEINLSNGHYFGVAVEDGANGTVRVRLQQATPENPGS